VAEAVRALCRQVGVPTSVAEAGVERTAYEAQLERLVDNAFNDTQMVTAVRAPSYGELEQLYRYAYEGRVVEF